MFLIATQPLLVDPTDRALAEVTLTTIARCRFVSRASLLAALGPQGLRPELLDGWFQAGLVHADRVRLDPMIADETAYVALTGAGARALAAATGKHISGVTAARLKRSSQKRAHDLCVGEVALAALVLHAEQSIDLVGVETDDQRLPISVVASEAGEAPERITLRPDAFVVTRTSMGRVGLLVEVDRGTVSTKTMGRRYHGYLAWQRDGGPVRDFGLKALRVVTVVPSETRLKALHDAALLANRERPSGFLLFALQDDLSVCVAERMLGPVAHQLNAVPGHRIPLLCPRDSPSAGLAAA
jgi:hypothetical protein